MGRKRIHELLGQLEANQERTAAVDAAIFTVAQVAVNELRERAEGFERQTKELPDR